ncbi:MAG: hypothetical protein NZT92_12905 [Abditibacteriales bacterium]|nr:hypothetical protein [Abditibacteriales bacterium]MDW8366873.1 hypothetical protein [Abditibacteriales bacterium]
MDWLTNNWRYIFPVLLAVLAFALGTLLLSHRQLAISYAGWLYLFGLLDPKQRESPAPARKTAWLLYLLGLLALGWGGWRYYYFHTMPVLKDQPSPYLPKQMRPGFRSPYARPGQPQPGASLPPSQPSGASQPPTGYQPLPPPTTGGKEEPPVENVPMPTRR